MSNRPGEFNFTGIEAQLRTRGVAADYVDRVIAELRDHHYDLCREMSGREAANRLGDPELLIEHITSQAPRDTFDRRHPILMYTVAPIGGLIAAAVAIVVSLSLIAQLLRMVTPINVYDPVLVDRSNLLLDIGQCFIPTALAVVMWHRAIHRQIARHWPIIGCLMLAVIAAFSQMQVMVTGADNQSGLVVCGLGMPTGIMRFILPMLVPMGWFVLHHAHRIRCDRAHVRNVKT